jgi:hypothetical protein
MGARPPQRAPITPVSLSGRFAVRADLLIFPGLAALPFESVFFHSVDPAFRLLLVAPVPGLL